jgi:hypothetical protein
MSNVTLNSIRQTDIGSELPTAQTKLPTSQQSSDGNSAPSAPIGDTVTISAAAKSVTATPAVATQLLNDSEATKTSVSLRQQLGAQNLSGTAKQNQAILSLLRG